MRPSYYRTIRVFASCDALTTWWSPYLNLAVDL